MERKVTMECHRYLGYVRFQAINDVLYSDIHPTYDILPLIASHFTDRFAYESFIIHDKTRGNALISKKGEWVIAPFNYNFSSTAKTDIYETLWKKYFDSISIENRKNLKLQQNFVPLKYRKDLLEFK